jgi:ribosomal protein S18 acetylase RimI-like enzyme
MIKIFNGKKLKIREMKRSDLKRTKDFLDYINSLVEEEAMISLKKKKTLKEEKEWLKNQLKEIKSKQRVVILAEDRNKIVGICECKLKKERESHVGELAVGVRKEYRGIGLGKFLFREILKLAKRKLKVKIFRLSVFEGNEIAKNLYKKFGFKEVAKIPKQIEYKGKLISEIVMIKEAK